MNWLRAGIEFFMGWFFLIFGIWLISNYPGVVFLLFIVFVIGVGIFMAISDRKDELDRNDK